MADSYLSEQEQRLKVWVNHSDLLWISCQRQHVRSVLDRLEEALKENERLRGTEKWLDEFAQELQDQVKDFQQMLEERDVENEQLKDEVVELRREIQSLG